MLDPQPRIEHVAQAVAEQVEAEVARLIAMPGNSVIHGLRECRGPGR